MKNKTFLSTLFMAAILVACSDDDQNEYPEDIPYPDVTEISISETVTSDTDPVSKEETYLFSNNLLTTHTTTQTFYGQSISYEVGFTYSGNQATFTDDSGNIATYTLGNDGYAESCVYKMNGQTREYAFSYSHGYLTQIDEKIDGEPYSGVQLQYQSGNLQTIRANGQNILCQAGDDINTYHLPCLALYDIYPLSYHIDAIYARLLGKGSIHLITRTAPEGNEKEWTTYTYLLDADNKPTRINASTTSTGTVIDIHGNSSEVTKTDSRTLNIHIK